ncbi:MAG: hypothetical protein WCF67_25700, partial [Chitinophagaceae bacterium]
MRSFLTAIGILLIVHLPATAQPRVTKYFQWHKEHHSIIDPVFSNAGNEIAFVSQLQIPGSDIDRITATDSLGAAFLRQKKRYRDSLLAVASRQERFTDPVVSILNIKTKGVESIDYGWSPGFSSDDNRIVYSFQTKPISGKRVLAQTLEGNSIKIYNRLTKQMKVIVTPDEDFLLSPVFLDDSNIVYQVGDAINGSYGGGAGVSKFNFITKRTERLYIKNNKYGNYSIVG